MYISKKRPGIAGLPETKLHKGIALDNMAKFRVNIWRKDRVNEKGEGLLIIRNLWLKANYLQMEKGCDEILTIEERQE